MSHRILVLTLLFLVLTGITLLEKFSFAAAYSPTFILGFLLLTAYTLGFILAKIGLPRITTYILCGLIFGPYLINLVTPEIINDLSFINSLALAFIAFCAGGELKLSNINKQLKSIISLTINQTVIVFCGVSVVVYLFVDSISVFSDLGFAKRLVVALIFGIISVARSPSSTIAIISETKAKGVFTDITLTVTVVKDVVVIILFGVVLSFCQLVVSENSSVSWHFVVILFFEVLISLTLGFVLGKGIVYLIETVKVEFPVVIIGIGFLVIKFSHLFTGYLHTYFDIAISLEPLLICMAAGFTVQNYSSYGRQFLFKMDNVSLPIYIIFFTITGASINLEILKSSWVFGVAIVLVRLAMLYLASVISGLMVKDRPLYYRNYWLGFITQAGVSLGLLTEIVRRFPTIGVPIQSLLIAAISINQLIGPIAFKFALNKVGDAKKQD